MLTGFGIFEKRDRAARTARNPATGATVKVKKTSVPAFRAGAEFKAITSGAKKLAKAPVSGEAAAKRPSPKASRPRLRPRRPPPRQPAKPGQEGAGQEGRSEGRPPRKKTTAKKAPAKAAKKSR